jgi:hypothetical protein
MRHFKGFVDIDGPKVKHFCHCKEREEIRTGRHETLHELKKAVSLPSRKFLTRCTTMGIALVETCVALQWYWLEANNVRAKSHTVGKQSRKMKSYGHVFFER